MNKADRLAWIKMYEATGSSGAVCSHFGISRQTLRKWLLRYQADGLKGLEEPSRRPKTSPNRKVFEQEEQIILELRRSQGLGVQKIRAELARQGTILSTHTILKVLRRAGEPSLRRAEAVGISSPPIRRKPAAAAPAPEGNQVAEAIVQMITNGDFRPGEKLNESELSRALNVGRSLVRAALQKLAPDGLVVFQKNRGAFVNNPSMREVGHAYAARRLIEGEIIKDVCAHCTAHDIRRLRIHVQRQISARDAGDRGSLIRLLTDFHVLVASLGENRALEEFVRSLAMKTSLAVLLYDHVGSSCAIEDHVHLIDLIAAGDSAGAQALLDEHLGSSLVRLPKASPTLFEPGS